MARVYDPFYDSPEWKAIRIRVLRRDHFRCTRCGVDVHGKGRYRVDHIKPRRQYPELSLDMANLRTLCPTCDNRRNIDQRFPDREPKPEINPEGYPENWQ